LDSIHLEYLPDFTITISNRWFQNGNEWFGTHPCPRTGVYIFKICITL
jgi:hypothetical protein